ncbi:hypothetical protein SDC9_126416 [bioreactor metagenome]|uniref:Uncharacterized protein n=1 Tax=bioreactor metagenome TaxID=1076179 RepID=A0A645CR34_9ZZZZ
MRSFVLFGGIGENECLAVGNGLLGDGYRFIALLDHLRHELRQNFFADIGFGINADLVLVARRDVNRSREEIIFLDLIPGAERFELFDFVRGVGMGAADVLEPGHVGHAHGIEIEQEHRVFGQKVRRIFRLNRYSGAAEQQSHQQHGDFFHGKRFFPGFRSAPGRYATAMVKVPTE